MRLLRTCFVGASVVAAVAGGTVISESTASASTSAPLKFVFVSEAQWNAEHTGLHKNATPDSSASANIASCFLTADNPHASSGAAGVIYKTRANCDHSYTVTVNGGLYLEPQVGPGPLKASSSGTQSAGAYDQTTFYTPATNGVKVPCNSAALYQGYSSGYFASNGAVADAAAQSQRVKAC